MCVYVHVCEGVWRRVCACVCVCVHVRVCVVCVFSDLSGKVTAVVNRAQHTQNIRS